MSKTSKYKLGTPEIIAFVVGVLVIIASNKYIFMLSVFENLVVREIVQIAVLGFFATLFGLTTGVLVGVLGNICVFAVLGMGIDYACIISTATFCFAIGRFADRYLIREGKYRIKQILLWNLNHILALIATYIFVRPFVAFLFYNANLMNELLYGIRLSARATVLAGGPLTLIFIVISSLSEYVKK